MILAPFAALIVFVAGIANEIWGKPFAQKILEDKGFFKEPLKHVMDVLAAVHAFSSAHVLWLLPSAFMIGGMLAFSWSRHINAALRKLGVKWRPRRVPSVASRAEDVVLAAVLADEEASIVVHRQETPARVSIATTHFDDLTPTARDAELVLAVDRLAAQGILADPIGRGEYFKLTAEGHRSAAMRKISRPARLPDRASHH